LPASALSSPPALFTLSLHDALPIWDSDENLPERLRSDQSTWFSRQQPRSHERGTSCPEPNPRPWRRGAVPANSCWKSSQRPSVRDRKSTRLNSSHVSISYAVFRLKK